MDLGTLTGSHIVWIFATGTLLAGYALTWFAALERAPAIDVTAVLVAGAVITALLQSGIRGVALPAPTGLVLLGIGAISIGVLSWWADVRRTR